MICSVLTEPLARACFINRLGSRNRLILMAQNRPMGIYETRSSNRWMPPVLFRRTLVRKRSPRRLATT